jgi:exopolyphosphatase / guanosine-5'-triphosphate,3'-diphosphate pyrophosphatase
MARRWYGWSSGPMLVIDIGGGSLEIASGRNLLPSFAASLPLGAGRLTREWLPDTRPSDHQVGALRRHVRHEIRDAVNRLRWEGSTPFAVGTSKTFRQLAVAAGAPRASVGPFVPRHLNYDDVKRWERRLAGMKPKSRARVRGISRRRAAQIVAGAVTARTVMRALNVEKVSICPWGLREGVILRRLDANQPPVAAKNQARLVLAARQRGTEENAESSA